MSDEHGWKRIGSGALDYCAECGAFRSVRIIGARYVVTEVTGGGAPKERTVVDLDEPSEAEVAP